MQKIKISKTLSLQLLAFGAFAIMAMSSASSKEERNANRDAFIRGWEIGSAIRDGASLDDSATDSLSVMPGDEIAEIHHDEITK